MNFIPVIPKTCAVVKHESAGALVLHGDSWSIIPMLIKNNKKLFFSILQDFGSIFSSLLPGTQAKLVAPDGRSILDGLEVKVAFGDVWKESLSELSGGQRLVHYYISVYVEPVCKPSL